MLFNSVSYVLFLPLCVIGYYLIRDKYKNLFLLAASYYFYMCWMPRYALLIGCSTLVTWLAAFVIDRVDGAGKRKLALALSVVINLGILFVFKYFNFFAGLLERIPGMGRSLPRVGLLLPVGISFYTFQALGYAIDVYRGKNGKEGVRHERNLINYALFVSFFPQLVAGPIERSANLLPQFRQKHRFSQEETVKGLRLILVGMFKKVVIADMLAMFVDKVFSDYSPWSGPILLLAVFFFTVQIYCDFSGYSDIARGSAQIFGFRLMKNFSAPYLSVSVKEFWNRWHISLSTWFRDYIYIPLGGSRRGFLRLLVNLMIVFVVSGLWHGAKMTFVVWGMLHGIYRIVEEIYKKAKGTFTIKENVSTGIKNAVGILFTFILVMLTWTFFRANSISEAAGILKSCLNRWDIAVFTGEYRHIMASILPDIEGIILLCTALMSIALLLLLVTDFCERFREKGVEEIIAKIKWGGVKWIIYYGMIVAILFCFIMTTNEYGQAGAFLYFQF